MNEHLYLLEQAEPVLFLGANNQNLQTLRHAFPKLRIIARGNMIKVIGDPDETECFVQLLSKLEDYTYQYNSLPESVLLQFISEGDTDGVIDKNREAILYGVGGQPIQPRTPNQARLAKKISENDLVFATGAAGTGKTFIAIAMAVKFLKSRQIKRIILSRPAVEAGEKLGFLPGEMKDKLDPYLQPLYDALMELIPLSKLREYMEKGVIQIAPLAFMRGRTLNDAVVILDEAQNTSIHQMKMFLTRLGTNSKMIVTGDISQIDLPTGTRSGLSHAEHLFKDKHKEIGWVSFSKKDVQRHGLVRKIVEAYENEEK